MAQAFYTPTNIGPSTLLDAVNSLIVSGGESPVSSVVLPRPDVQTANALIRESTREVCGEGWKFNTEHGVEMLPTGTLSVTDETGDLTLNIFEPPVNLMSFRVTEYPDQYDLDTVVRPPREWLGGGMVFYDRTKNRDGFTRDRLYINPTWLFDYEALPQLAKNLVYIRARKQYLAQVVGDLNAAARQDREEIIAYRALKREFGYKDKHNIFTNFTTSRHHGGRYFDQSRIDDRRIERQTSVSIPGYTTVVSISITPSSVSIGVEADPSEDVQTISFDVSGIGLDPPEGAMPGPLPTYIALVSDTTDLGAPGVGSVASLTFGVSDVGLDPPAGTPLPRFPSSIEVVADEVAFTDVAEIELSPSSASLSSGTAPEIPTTIELDDDTAALVSSDNDTVVTMDLSPTSVGVEAGAVPPIPTTMVLGNSTAALGAVASMTVSPSSSTVDQPSNTPSTITLASSSASLTRPAVPFTWPIGTLTKGQYTSATLTLDRSEYNGALQIAGTFPTNTGNTSAFHMRLNGGTTNTVAAGVTSLTLEMWVPTSFSGTSLTFFVWTEGTGVTTYPLMFTCSVV